MLYGSDSTPPLQHASTTSSPTFCLSSPRSNFLYGEPPSPTHPLPPPLPKDQPQRPQRHRERIPHPLIKRPPPVPSLLLRKPDIEPQRHPRQHAPHLPHRQPLAHARVLPHLERKPRAPLGHQLRPPALLGGEPARGDEGVRRREVARIPLDHVGRHVDVDVAGDEEVVGVPQRDPQAGRRRDARGARRDGRLEARGFVDDGVEEGRGGGVVRGEVRVGEGGGAAGEELGELGLEGGVDVRVVGEVVEGVAEGVGRGVAGGGVSVGSEGGEGEAVLTLRRRRWCGRLRRGRLGCVERAGCGLRILGGSRIGCRWAGSCPLSRP